MSGSNLQLAIYANPKDTIDVTIRMMALHSKSVVHPGLAVIVDDCHRLLGVLTDGDFRRAYAKNVNFDDPVDSIMTSNPITLPVSMPREKIISEVNRKVRELGRHQLDWIKHVILIDENRCIVDILDFFELVNTQGNGGQRVAIFGMGFVGLTLAVAISNRGHKVLGIDVNEALIRQLSSGLPHIHEPGLSEMLNINLASELISFDTKPDNNNHDIYIIAVGTPIDEHGIPDLRPLHEVLTSIGGRLKKGNQVMLRSTVPAGTSRSIVIPELEKISNLKPGKDFFVAFVPERTIEGRALQELRDLPQIIGGYTSLCTRKAVDFWSTLSTSIVQLPSLEGAELVKLANNTYRDLSFAFANELALLADNFNVDAFELISAANEGYPRNRIPHPSPGVGGYCLTKDPFLFSSTPFGVRKSVTLGRAGRLVNRKAANYPVSIILRFAKKIGKNISELNVLIVGIAFKGEPENTDMRSSTSVDVAESLSRMTNYVKVWDAVVSPEEIRKKGLEPVSSLECAVKNADAILILNNHRSNTKILQYLKGGVYKLVFDGWHQLDAKELERIPGIIYGTMGYLSIKNER